MKTFVMAWRNIWRNKRRTLVTVAAMALALCVMILYSGLIEGYLQGLERNILDLEMGDLQIVAESYRDDPSLYKVIEQPDVLISRIEAKGYAATPRLLASGLAAAGDASAGVSFIGVTPEQDQRVSRVFEHVRKGIWLSADEPKGVVIGGRLSRNLGVNLDDELVVLSQAADGSIANDLYRVRGILGNISDNIDRGGIFLLASEFRELFVLPRGVHQIVVRRPNGSTLEQTAVEVKGLAAGLDAQTWRELLPTMASMLDSTSSMMFVMFLIVYFAIGIVILNAMLMAVFERIREFGVLKAIGVGPTRVLFLIFFESSYQVLLALGLGGLLCVPGLWYLTETGIDFTWIGGVSVAGIAWDPVWRASVSTEVIVAPTITLLAIVAVAVLYPAMKAAWISPIRALRQR